MSQETQQEQIDSTQEKVEAPVTETTELSNYSDEEKEALEQGWDPNKEFSAAEYLRRGELFKKITTQSTQIREMKDAFKNLTEHFKKTEAASYEKALYELSVQKQRAVEAGDVDTFNNVEQQANILKQEMDKKTISSQKTVDPAVAEFADRHKNWFNNNPENQEMVSAALFMDQYLGKTRPDLSPPEILKLIETRMQKLYPDKFTNPKKEGAPSITTSTTSKVSRKGNFVSRLSDQQKMIGEQIIRYTPGYTLEKYAEELDKQGNLGK